MDLNEALQDVETIRTLAAGMSRKRDGIYPVLAGTYGIGRKWLESGLAREMRDAVRRGKLKSLIGSFSCLHSPATHVIFLKMPSTENPFVERLSVLQQFYYLDCR